MCVPHSWNTLINDIIPNAKHLKILDSIKKFHENLIKFIAPLYDFRNIYLNFYTIFVLHINKYIYICNNIVFLIYRVFEKKNPTFIC